jgi:hypothetical protein
MILFQEVVQILDWSMAAAAAQGSFSFHSGNRRAVEADLIGVDDAGLGMRWLVESFAEQAFGRRPCRLSLRPPFAVERTSPTEPHTFDIVSFGVLKAAFQGGLQQ